MSQSKMITIVRLLIQYGFLTHGILLKGWSPLFLVFALWVDCILYIIFTDILVLVSKGSDKLKFILKFSFVSLFAAGIFLLFFIGGSIALAKQDTFLLNFVVLFFSWESPEKNMLLQVLLGSQKIILPDIFRKDILQIIMLIATTNCISTLIEIIRLKGQNKEWKDSQLTSVSFFKMFFILASTFILVFFTQDRFPLGIIFIITSLGADLLLLRNNFQTLGDTLQKKQS